MGVWKTADFIYILTLICATTICIDMFFAAMFGLIFHKICIVIKQLYFATASNNDA